MTRCDDPCNNDTLTPAEKWRATVGTESTGNLPEYKKNQHLGHCWAPCPYSTQSEDNRTRNMLKLSSGDPLPTRVYHETDGKEHYMQTEHRGGWGFLCTYSGCTYLIDNEKQYFYR